jgi:hypothetical protein
MGKRCARFERRPRDFYRTPEEAVAPLIPHLRAARVRTFAEPCAGDGALVQHLELHGLRCVYAGDISTGQDALARERFGAPVITNPPWSRDVLHALISHFMRAAPFTWLLFDSDWAHTRQATALIQQCAIILPIGRVKWIPGTEHAGLDNAAWYRFDAEHAGGPIQLAYRCDSATDSGPRRCSVSQCARPYWPLRSDSRFCSDACRQRAPPAH